MAKFSVDVASPVNSEAHSTDTHHAPAAEPDATDTVSDAPAVQHEGSDAAAVAMTVGVVVVGAAVVEAALIPAILVGAAAALAPKYLPKLSDRLQPLFNSTVRGLYKMGRRARSAVGEAQERIHDIAAEVQAEETAEAATVTPAA